MNLNESPIYNIWRYIKTICYNEEHRDYNKFGAIGIEVLELWKEDFDSFYQWAINNGYKKESTLIRFSNSDHFTPTNCMFLSKKHNWYFSRNKPFPSRLLPPPKQLKEWHERRDAEVRKEWMERNINVKEVITKIYVK